MSVYHIPFKEDPTGGPACGAKPATVKTDPSAKARPCPDCQHAIRERRCPTP